MESSQIIHLSEKEASKVEAPYVSGLQVASDEEESDGDRVSPLNSQFQSQVSETTSPEGEPPRIGTPRIGFSTKRELLELAASMHFGGEENSRASLRESNSVLETRSSLSSRGRGKLSDRLKSLSRNQRKALLSKKAPGPPQLRRENSIIEEEDESIPAINNRKRAHSPRMTDHELDLALLREEIKTNVVSGPSTYLESESKTLNNVKLHIYDLISQDTLVQLPWGCVCAVGKCFTDFNSALHQLGTGAYHVGVEVNGIEYAFGATSTTGKSGVFSCIPKFSPGYQYRTTIDMGERELIRRSWVSVVENGKSSFRQIENYVDGRQVMKEMAPDYMGTDYDILRKNCCTFARDACLRLGIPDEEIPSWFRNLANAGAMTQDLAVSTVEPLTNVLSACDQEATADDLVVITEDTENGFEIVAQRNPAGTKDYLMVMEAKSDPISLRRTVSWA